MLEIPKEIITRVCSALIAAHILADEKGPPLLADKINEALTELEDAVEDSEATEP